MINVTGARNIAGIFGTTAPVYYMSTDLVFSGNNTPLGGYTEDEMPCPISVAGRTFYEAEKIIQTCPESCIVRLGLPLGDSVTGDHGAIDWIAGRFKRNLPVTLFYDEYRSCVDCRTIGEMAVKMIHQELRGIYHFGGDKRWSLYDIGQYVIKQGNYQKTLLTGIMRAQEKNGPPRIGDVSLNSQKMRTRLLN